MFLDRVKRPSEEDWDQLLLVVAADNEKVGYCNCCCWLQKNNGHANKETVTVNFGCVYA